MYINKAAKIGAPVGAAGAAGAGAIGAPVIIGAAVALVIAGGICAGIGVLASNSKEASAHVDKGGIDINFKK